MEIELMQMMFQAGQFIIKTTFVYSTMKWNQTNGLIIINNGNFVNVL